MQIKPTDRYFTKQNHHIYQTSNICCQRDVPQKFKNCLKKVNLKVRFVKCKTHLSYQDQDHIQKYHAFLFDGLVLEVQSLTHHRLQIYAYVWRFGSSKNEISLLCYICICSLIWRTVPLSHIIRWATRSQGLSSTHVFSNI